MLYKLHFSVYNYNETSVYGFDSPQLILLYLTNLTIDKWERETLQHHSKAKHKQFYKYNYLVVLYFGLYLAVSPLGIHIPMQFYPITYQNNNRKSHFYLLFPVQWNSIHHILISKLPTLFWKSFICIFLDEDAYLVQVINYSARQTVMPPEF